MSNEKKIYIWDNGEEFLDHSIWFIETDLDQANVEAMLNAAVSPFAKRGGLVGVVDADKFDWKQNRVESLENWFTCHGDELVDWRTRTVHESLLAFDKEVIRDLASRLYPSNTDIVAERAGFEW